MNLFQFLDLSSSSQQQYLYCYGELISEIETRHYYSSLFLLDNFYAEVFLCKHTDEVLDIRLQSDPDILLAYLEELHIYVAGNP